MSRTLWLLSVLLTGCLPLGSEPAGRHVVHDRTLSSVLFAPSQSAGTPAHLLVFGQVRESLVFEYGMADLYVAPPDAPAGPARGVDELTLLLSDARHPGPYDSRFFFEETDARGRIVAQRAETDAPNPAVWRVDPASAAREWLGSTFPGDPLVWRDKQITLSPKRERVVVARPGAGWALYEADGDSVEVPSADEGSAGFVDEDFFYTVDDWSDSPSGEAYVSHSIRVLPPQGRPELVATNVRMQEGFSTSRGPRLVAIGERRAGISSTPDRALLLDPTAGEAQAISFAPLRDTWLGHSPDLQWLAWREPSGVRFFNWMTGDDVVSASSPLSSLGWRPGHGDLWFSAGSVGDMLVLGPDKAPKRIYARPHLFWVPGTTTWSLFTPSGRHWLVRDFCVSAAATCGQEGAAWSDEAIHVGSADQPTALPTQIAAKGVTLYRVWELADGRIMAEGYTQDAVRSDLYLFDPRSLVTTVFPLKGFVVATGQGRALVFANWELGRWAGRLVLLDLATGEETELAESAYDARVDPGSFADAPPEDRLAPGTRVAYLVRHHIDSEWDGLWVAQLP